ncbi:helix-turn-helix domain-containing protein [Kocuria rosea]|uniref:helix-turn-helix domain-containing protein n=1 Tax=Kocuria rosea TaxID=1275 RepID=UPI003D3415D7
MGNSKKVVTITTKRWPKGTYMKLRSADLLKAFIGPEPDKKMSGRKLARYAGVDPSFINHLTAGRRSSCTPIVAQRIAEALEVPLTVLFDPVETLTKRQIEAQQRAKTARAQRKVVAA